MTNYEKILKARNVNRITSQVLLDKLADEYIEMHGDRLYGDDRAVITALGMIGDLKVTFVCQEKGTTIETRMEHNFGMAHPEGYRKAKRMIKQAEKFGRPIVFVIDTAGAYPGIESEKRGQGNAIAEMLFELADLKVPVISIILSEGGSGGALAFGVCDYMYCFENAFYTVISPEGYAEILYKGKKEPSEVVGDMKITSKDLLNLKVVDEIVEEPQDIMTVDNCNESIASLKVSLIEKLTELQLLGSKKLIIKRQKRYRSYGE